jgi:hypothetical protein
MMCCASSQRLGRRFARRLAWRAARRHARQLSGSRKGLCVRAFVKIGRAGHEANRDGRWRGKADLAKCLNATWSNVRMYRWSPSGCASTTTSTSAENTGRARQSRAGVVRPPASPADGSDHRLTRASSPPRRPLGCNGREACACHKSTMSCSGRDAEAPPRSPSGAQARARSSATVRPTNPRALCAGCPPRSIEGAKASSEA